MVVISLGLMDVSFFMRSEIFFSRDLLFSSEFTSGLYESFSFSTSFLKLFLKNPIPIPNENKIKNARNKFCKMIY